MERKENKEKELKIGDYIYRESYRYGMLEDIRLIKVQRFTNTLIILEDGQRLKREPRNDRTFKKYPYEYSYSSQVFKKATDENIERCNEFNREALICKWFDEFKRNATMRDKMKVYNIFNKKEETNDTDK